MNPSRRALLAVSTLAALLLASAFAAPATAQPTAPLEPPAAPPAFAPPGQVAPGQGAPAQPVTCNPCYLMLPQHYAPPALSAEELDLLAEGEISGGRHAAGVLAAIYLGFGAGQAVQGRWSEKGWIYTLGEPLALAVLLAGAAEPISHCIAAPSAQEYPSSCEGGRSRKAQWMIAGGLIGFVGLRIWEIGDSFVGPGGHNRKVRALRQRVGMQPTAQLAPYLVPSLDGSGATAGVTARF